MDDQEQVEKKTYMQFFALHCFVQNHNWYLMFCIQQQNRDVLQLIMGLDQQKKLEMFCNSIWDLTNKKKLEKFCNSL